MATKQKTSAPESDLPEGFETLGFTTCDGWYLVEEGNVLRGTYLEAFTVDGEYGKKVVHKVRLTAPGCKATVESNKVESMAVGQVVGIDEKGWLKKLAGVVAGNEVYIKCTGKGEAKKGQSAPWTFIVGVKKASPDNLAF